nr:MAG: hypothetical protein [Penaeus semisulcatus pemonivirus]
MGMMKILITCCFFFVLFYLVFIRDNIEENNMIEETLQSYECIDDQVKKNDHRDTTHLINQEKGISTTEAEIAQGTMHVADIDCLPMRTIDDDDHDDNEEVDKDVDCGLSYFDSEKKYYPSTYFTQSKEYIYDKLSTSGFISDVMAAVAIAVDPKMTEDSEKDLSSYILQKFISSNFVYDVMAAVAKALDSNSLEELKELKEDNSKDFTNMSAGSIYIKYDSDDSKNEEGKQERTQSLLSLCSEMNVPAMSDVIVFERSAVDDIVQMGLRRNDEYTDNRRDEMTCINNMCTIDVVHSEDLDISNSGCDEYNDDPQGSQSTRGTSKCFDMMVRTLNVVFASINKSIDKLTPPNILRLATIIANAFTRSNRRQRRRRQQQQQQQQQQQRWQQEQESDTYIRDIYQEMLDEDIEKVLNSPNSI